MAETKFYLELQPKKKRNLRKGLLAFATQYGPWEGSVILSLFSIT